MSGFWKKPRKKATEETPGWTVTREGKAKRVGMKHRVKHFQGVVACSNPFSDRKPRRKKPAANDPPKAAKPRWWRRRVSK